MQMIATQSKLKRKKKKNKIQVNASFGHSGNGDNAHTRFKGENHVKNLHHTGHWSHQPVD
jgi:hypothetical protein